MGSDDFISLGDPETQDSSNQTSVVCGGDVEKLSCSQQPEDGLGHDGCEKASDEDQHVQDMDLEDDLIENKGCLQVCASATTVVKLSEVAGEKVKANVDAGDASSASKDASLDESPSKRLKRMRVATMEKQPTVHVKYEGLTRESKRKLVEMMQEWSEWHAKHQSSSKEPSDGSLENGEETYYPARNVGSEKVASVSCSWFWLDNQATTDCALDNDSAPIYDREFPLTSTLGDSAISDRAGKDDSRCFNCGSYGHSLKECPKPRDNVAIANARKQHNLRRTQSSGNQVQNRYYQKTPGKFDDLKAGVLGPETRECLGIGENDPPPWLHRMRQLGYPPGYLDVYEDEDQPSGITIFGDNDSNEDIEEGELPERDNLPPKKKMTVKFPGINAPIPENANQWLWGAGPAIPPASNYVSHERHWSSDSSRDREHELTPGLGQWVPPQPLFFHQGQSPYDRHENSTPSLGRSLSDRGAWMSPVPYDASPRSPNPFSPHRHPFTRQPPHYQFPASHDGWNDQSPYGSSGGGSGLSNLPRERHERPRAHHHQHRR